MKTKNLKTYVLIGLILSSVILTGKIWFNEKLWPEGYNFFAVITDKLSFGKDKFISSLTKETISFPKNIVINNLEKRSVYAADSEIFSNISPDVRELLRLALEKSETESATEEVWAAALQGRSMHIVYPVAYDSKLFLNILGSYQTGDSSIPVREFIITADEPTEDAISVYIKNHSTSEILKAKISWDKARLDKIIDTYATDSIGNLSYSSELNFDKAGDGDEKQKVVIESNVLIQLNKKLNNMIREINPLYEYGFNGEVVESFLKSFGYNVSGARKYVEHDNSVVYVENYSTLKFHPNGLLEYSAVDDTKGINVGGSGFYESLLGCVDFVNLLWGDVFPHKPLNINISSDIVDIKSNSFKLTMDYFTDGAQVNISIPQGTSHPPINNGVEIEVVNGKIVSYRQVMAFFEPAEFSADSVSAIDALDELIEEGNIEGKVVRDLYPTYISDGTDLRKSAWAVRTSDNQISIID